MKKILSVFVAVMLAVIMVVPAFAYDMGGVSTPDFTSGMVERWNAGRDNLVLITQSGNKILLMMDGKPVMKMGSGYRHTIYNDSGATITASIYILDSDNNWSYSGANTYADGSSVVSIFDSIHWATFDLVDADTGSILVRGDTNFLRPSLEEEILGVTQETLEGETFPEINRVMLVLTTVGVGLLALLIVLSLFGKRSLIYRH